MITIVQLYTMTSLPSWMTESKSPTLTEECPSSRRKWVVIGACASATTAIVAGLWPFISPALRKVCLPYVPATPAQVCFIYDSTSSVIVVMRLLSVVRLVLLFLFFCSGSYVLVLLYLFFCTCSSFPSLLSSSPTGFAVYPALFLSTTELKFRRGL